MKCDIHGNCQQRGKVNKNSELRVYLRQFLLLMEIMRYVGSLARAVMRDERCTAVDDNKNSLPRSKLGVYGCRKIEILFPFASLRSFFFLA